MYKKGIIFDNVGPLLEDSLADISWIASKYGIDPDTLNKAKDEVWVREFSVNPEMSAYMFWKEVLGKADGYHPDIMIEDIDNEMIERHRPVEGMLDYARGLRENPDVRTALWTNVSKDWFRKFDKKHGLTKIFDYVMASGIEGKRKDNPDVVKKMMESLKNDGCVSIACVDDQERNVRILEQAGASPAILHTDEQDTIQQLDRFLYD